MGIGDWAQSPIPNNIFIFYYLENKINSHFLNILYKLSKFYTFIYYLLM